MDRQRALEITQEFFAHATPRELLDILLDETRYPVYGEDENPEEALREELTFYTNRLKKTAGV